MEGVDHPTWINAAVVPCLTESRGVTLCLGVTVQLAAVSAGLQASLPSACDLLYGHMISLYNPLLDPYAMAYGRKSCS